MGNKDKELVKVFMMNEPCMSHEIIMFVMRTHEIVNLNNDGGVFKICRKVTS